jgi:cytochrome c3-like protein/cytochrome c554/c'-like protein
MTLKLKWTAWVGFWGTLCLSLLIPGRTIAQTNQNTCLDCHSALEGNLQVTADKWATDIHKVKGFGCIDCHGGDPTQMDDKLAMNRSKGFLGAPKGLAIVQMCGKCHSDAAFMKKYNPAERVDQVSEYFSSVHGKRLKDGDINVATCVSCHGVHEIRLVSDPRARVYPLNVADTCGLCHSNAQLMVPYHIKTNQKEEYQKSVHYEALVKKGDLSAPTCNKCHGNHGATPPGIGSVVNVCGQCHAVFADMFDKSPHKAAFAKMDLPSCVHCHGNHEIKRPTDDMLGVADGAVCVQCHVTGDTGYQQAASMRKGIDQLKVALAGSESLLTEAEQKGMEVSQPKYDLIEGRQDLTKARTQVHSFNAANVEGDVKEGLKIAARTEEKGKQALSEYQFRRKGLAVSLIIILAVIVTLYFKIKDIEHRQKAE